MKIPKTTILLALVCLAINISGCTKQNVASGEIFIPIKAKLNEEIANMACVSAWPYPFSSRERPDADCMNCDKFAEAGLLTKEVVEDPFPSDTPSRYKPTPEIRFELTELGSSAYIRGTDDSSYGKVPSRFCFGKAHVKEITRVIGPVMNGRDRLIGIRYIAELENPNPFINDPRFKLLGIPLPLVGQMAAGKTVLYPEANVTAVFNPADPKDFYLDASLQIGQ